MAYSVPRQRRTSTRKRARCQVHWKRDFDLNQISTKEKKERNLVTKMSRCIRSYFFDNLKVTYDELRLVLLGKTGNGKSASGNTILNLDIFKTEFSPSSVTTDCSKARGMVDGRRVAIIDTPGIYDTKYKEDEVVRKLKKCISLSAPGPHAFLIVIKLDKFTKEEQKTVELLQTVFGKNAADYTMVLFTHGDRLQHTSVEDFFSKNQQLSRLIKKCNRRYHVFDNTVPSHSQVSQLLAKILTIVSDNGGTFYTNEMFEKAERAIREQAEMFLKATAEQQRREEEKLRTMFDGKQLPEKLKTLRKFFKSQSRKKAEEKNKFIETGLILTTAEVGIAIGLAVGSVGGPLCMGIGAVVGGVSGAIVGVLTPAAGKALMEKCSIQ